MDVLGLLNRDDLAAIVTHINLKDNLELSSAALSVFDKIMDETFMEQSSIYTKDRLLLYLEQCNLLSTLMENFLWRLAFVEKACDGGGYNEIYSSVANLGLTNIIKIQAIEFLLKHVNSKSLNISHFLLGFYKVSIPSASEDHSKINCLNMLCHYLNYEFGECKFLLYEPRKIFVEKCLEMLHVLLNNDKYCYQTSRYIQNSNFLLHIQNIGQMPHGMIDSILKLVSSGLMNIIRAPLLKESINDNDQYYIYDFLKELNLCKQFYQAISFGNSNNNSSIALIQTFAYLLIVAKLFCSDLNTNHACHHLLMINQNSMNYKLYLILSWFFRRQQDQNLKVICRAIDPSTSEKFKICLFILDVKYKIATCYPYSDSVREISDDSYYVKFLFINNFLEKGQSETKGSFNKIQRYLSNHDILSDLNLKSFVICELYKNMKISRLKQWNMNFDDSIFNAPLDFLDVLVASGLISIDQYIANLKLRFQAKEDALESSNNDFNLSKTSRCLIIMYSIFKEAQKVGSNYHDVASLLWNKVIESLISRSSQDMFCPLLYIHLGILFLSKKAPKNHFINQKTVSTLHAIHLNEAASARRDPIISKWAKIMIDI